MSFLKKLNQPRDNLMYLCWYVRLRIMGYSRNVTRIALKGKGGRFYKK